MTMSPSESSPASEPVPLGSDADDTTNVVSLHSGRRHRPRELDVASNRLSRAQRSWLARGLDQPGGKLPLFDRDGRRVSDRTVKSCIRQGWAVPWFDNPIKPDWLICKLTDDGRRVLAEDR
jgi:hypothetical protein